MDEIKAQFETAVFGAIRVMKAVLPTMRKQQGGTIVIISSMAGRVGFPLFPAYTGTKFALEGISESMRLEIASLDIRIILIEPGTIRSNFASNAILW
jgi:NAD(P)-dependent dehydrogenase (short-subunit alcohol dehydrogenase family)